VHIRGKFFNEESELAYDHKYEKIRNWTKAKLRGLQDAGDL
jgi:hypothetical protein